MNTELFKTKTKDGHIYVNEGKEGILDFVNAKLVFIPLEDIERTNFDFPQRPPLLTYDDYVKGNYRDKVAITNTQVINVENKHQIFDAWVSIKYAHFDNYLIGYFVRTDKSYNWTSYRTIFENQIKAITDSDDFKVIYNLFCDYSLYEIKEYNLVNDIIKQWAYCLGTFKYMEGEWEFEMAENHKEDYVFVDFLDLIKEAVDGVTCDILTAMVITHYDYDLIFEYLEKYSMHIKNYSQNSLRIRV